jgi:CHAD domain-containing protein
MKESLERELKLRAGEDFELPDLGGEPLEPRVFVSTYHDTPDFRLARSGVTLRRRVENGRGLWQLKLPRGAARLEFELAGGPAEPPGEIVRLLPALTRCAELVPIARLRTRRVGVRVQDDGRSLADVIFDSVSVMDGRRVTRTFEELEIELLDGDERSLRRIERALRRAGAGEEEERPKVVQALGLQFEDESRPVEPPTTVEALRAMFELQLERMLAHDPGTRLGSDPEDLHQLRVATRRLRAFLRAARPVLEPEWAEGLRAELGWLGGALGPVRDLDVLLEHLREEAASLDAKEQKALSGLFTRLEADREQARSGLIDALESDRYIELLNRLEEAAQAPRVLEEERTLGSLWKREWKRLRKAAGSVGDEASDGELHRARIKTKRARYAAELAEPAMGKPADRFVQGAKRLQDVLGEHQDAVVAEERIRALLRGSRSSTAQFAAGRLVERQRARRIAARAGFEKAWRELERRGKRAAKSE